MQRLKNEWSNGIFRQSSDEKTAIARQTYDGGGSGRHQLLSSDSDDSCRHASYVIRSDSGSDSDPKKWTKNPLVVRRVKRSDKLKQAEKRFSGTENVFSSKNKDSLVSHSNEENRNRTAYASVKNTSSKDEGSGSRGSSKYQKLEQMRKLRLNLSVTSDEENVPQKPQPHRWSGSNIRNVTVTNKDTDPAAHQGMVRSQFSQELYKPVNSPPAFAPQSYLPTSHSIQSPPAASSYQLKQHAQPSIATSAPMSHASTGLGVQSGTFGLAQTTSRLGHIQTHVAGHFPESNVTSSRQTFHPLSRMAGSESSPHKITDITSPRSNQTVFSYPSNFTTHRVTPQVHAPSLGSARDSNTNATTIYPLMTSQTPPYLKARQTPPQDRIQSANVIQPSSYVTSGLEKRRTVTTSNESKSPQKIPKKIPARPGMLHANDDSLDELVESNIQYLSSDVENAQPKKSTTTNVTKFSSLPDHGKMASRVVSNTTPQNQASIQVQASTTIQLHVTLPVETPRLGASLIQIAPSVDSDYRPSFGFRNQLTSQPDLIPRYLPQDVYSPLSQTCNNYNKDSMVRPVSQVETRVALPGRHTVGTVHTRMGFGDQKTRSDTEISLHAPKLDKGMFSDAEYDIEVSERVKKWETLLKVRDSRATSDKKDLITISESVDSDPCIPPSSNVHKAVVPSRPSHFPFSYACESNQPTVPRVLSIETNARRFFQVIPDSRPNIQSQGVNSRMFHAPLSLRPEKTFTSASELRQQVLANRVHQLPGTSGPVQVTYKPPLPADNGQQVPSQKDFSYNGQQITSHRGAPYTGQQVTSQRDAPYTGQQVTSQRDAPYTGQQVTSQRDAPYTGQQVTIQKAVPYTGQQVASQKDTPVVKRTSNTNDVRNSEKRGSKYREELDEISYMKCDSVGNLRRRFDTDSTNATSEDDKKSVSTASAKLAQPSKEYSSQKESPDWSHVLPSYHTKVKESEVWSPNLESTQGVPVSIERVTARTLQTIPFSEDPFWKEIEQMTSFDPTSKEVLLTTEPIRSHHQVQLIPPQSFTLPTQPHRNVTSFADKLQKSKSLYTPNITPLTVDVSRRSPSTAASALDDVLNDINRSPKGRQQLSPKKRSLELDSSPTNAATSNISQFLKTRPKSGQLGRSENGQQMFMIPGHGGNMGSTRTLESGLRGLNRSEVLTSQQQQPLQFVQQPRHPLQLNLANRQPQASQGFTNNYQLDPNLLKQKLLSTGLVVETEVEEIADRGHYQSPSVDRHDITTTRSSTVQPYNRIASKLHNDARVEKPMATTTSQHLSNSNISVTNKNMAIAPPGKQPGSKTLDEIQKALAPFSSAPYQPDPETLYGASKLRAFRDNTCDTSRGEHTCDTSRGEHTSATGWSYHTELNQDIERSDTVDSCLSTGSSRLQEVHESMDDLTNLARDVELRISDIKSKLQTADETSLDRILHSLRKLTPEVRAQESDSTTLEDYCTKKKSKLSDALSELDRIYTSLELNAGDISTRHQTEKLQPDSSSYSVRGPQPKSVHLRPMQTRISSMFIRDIDTSKIADSQEKESEFDVISKSFQAIVDEVNQTTDLLSRAVERSKQGNLAPETHRLVPKSTVKPAAAGNENISTVNSSRNADTAPALQNSLNHLLNAAKLTAGEVTNTSSLPSSSGQQQTRFRPVKDNKIIQGDKATRKDSEEKVLKAMPSPKASPTLVRKLFSGGPAPQTVQQLPCHDSSVKQPAEAKTAPLQVNGKEQTTLVKDNDARKSSQSVQPSPLSSKSKVVSSMENNQAETLVLDSNTGIDSNTTLPSAPKSEIDKLPAALPAATIVSKPTDNNSVRGGLGLSSTSASIASSIFVPAVTNSKQSRLALAGTKLEQLECTSKNGNKTKRQIGSGVAMILGKFSSSQESIDGSKKSTTTRSGDNDDSVGEDMDKEDVSAEAQHTADDKVISEANMKNSVRTFAKTKPVHSYDVKHATPSSLERKLVDPEAKMFNSGASPTQPSSPVNKPPQSPWKRHTSDPEKQSVADAIKAYSPKFASKIPRPASSNGSTASDGYFTPKELDSPRQVAGSPGVATGKERPPTWKSPISSPRGRGRPHSFHELISVFEKDSPSRLQTFDKFRKSASAGEVSSNDILLGKGFRCEKTVPEETAPEK